MEGKTKTATGKLYEKWINYEKQTDIQYLWIEKNGQSVRKFRFRFRFRGKLYSEVIGVESKTFTAKKVEAMWEKYEANRTLGQEPFSPGRRIEIDEAISKAEKEAAAKAASRATPSDKILSIHRHQNF